MCDCCSDSDVMLDESEEDEESPPIECAFFSKFFFVTAKKLVQ